ncbi:MAG: hypothetical protein V4696_01780 [Pseudomonadota bacterium]
MIEQVGSALLANGPIGILCVVLWLQNREAMKRELDRQTREDDRNHRNELITRDRITADIEMAKGLTSQAEKFDAFGKMLERLAK